MEYRIAKFCNESYWHMMGYDGIQYVCICGGFEDTTDRLSGLN